MNLTVVITWILGICTLLGGIAAVLYFREKQANRPTERRKLLQRGRKLGYSDEVLEAPDKALEALLKRPKLWEYRFLQAALADQLEKRRRLKLDLRYGAPLPSGTVLDTSSSATWVQGRFSSAERMAEELKGLIHEAVPEALGPPGVSGDPLKLLHTAVALGHLYEKAIQWALDFSRVSPPHSQARLFALLPKCADSFVEAIEETRDKLWLFIEDYDRSPPAPGEQRVVEMMITLRDSIPPEVHEEIRRLNSSHGDA